jgi:glycosyltransferase 2 family protein
MACDRGYFIRNIKASDRWARDVRDVSGCQPADVHFVHPCTMTSKVGRQRGSLAIRILGLLVSALALWLVLRSVDLGACATVLSRANPIPLAACLAVIATQVVLRSFRWRLLLPPPPGRGHTKVTRIIPVLLVGYLGNAVLPARLGEPVRAYLVARREQLDAVESFGSVVLERVVDTATLAVMACVAAVAVNAPSWIIQATAVAALIGSAVTAALVAVGPGRLVRLARRLVAPLPVATRAEPILKRLDDFARGIDRPSQSSAVVVAAGVSAICWALDATTFWLVAQSVGSPVSPAAALLIGAVTVLGTALPSAPGYVGTFELAAAATAQALGVAAAPALALAVLAHATTVLPTAGGGAVSLVAMNARLGRLATDAAAERAVGEAATRT